MADLGAIAKPGERSGGTTSLAPGGSGGIEATVVLLDIGTHLAIFVPASVVVRPIMLFTLPSVQRVFFVAR